MSGQVVTVSVGERRSWAERLDGLIGIVSPKWAAERAAWRGARRDLEWLSYRGAERARTDKPAGRNRGSADYQLEMGRERAEMVFRARQLEQDNGIAEGLLARSVENLVGTGIRPQARSKSKAWNKKVEALFAAYAENCDVRGLDSLWDLQALTVRSYLRDGDAATHMLSDGRLQSIESDQISSPIGKYGDPRFADGIELDTAGRPLRFHIVDERDRMSGPGVNDRASLTKRIEIDAKDVLYLSRRTRLQQTRGLTVFAQSFWLFDQLDGNIEATTIAARIAACFGAVIKRVEPFNGPPIKGANGANYKEWSLEPGMMRELNPGDEIQQITPQQPTQNFGEFVTLLSRLLGIPLGLPIELVLLDSSRANFSSMRGSLMQAFKTWRRMLSAIIFQWCRPLWRRRVRMWIDAGEIEDVEDWDRHVWVPPGWTWVDPKAEVESNLLAVDAGFRTLHDIVAEQGGDFDEMIETRKQEIKDLEAAGIPCVRSVSTRDPLPPPVAMPTKDPAKRAAKKMEKQAAEAARLKAQEDEVTRDEMRTELQLMESRLSMALMARHQAPAAPAASPFAQLSLPGAQIHTPAGTVFRLEASPQLLDRAEAAATTVAASVDKLTTAAKEGAASVASAAQAIAEKRIDWPVIPTPPAPIVNNTIIAQPGEIRNEIKVEVEAKLPAQTKRVVEVSDGRGGMIKGTIGPA